MHSVSFSSSVIFPSNKQMANKAVVSPTSIKAFLRHADPARLSAFAVCGLLGVVTIVSAAGHRSHGAQAFSAASAPGVSPVTVPVTVSAGDSLWSLANRYGDPDRYIQDRVDALARTNRLSASESLLPGQRLLVPVENPVELARLQRHLTHR